MIQFGTIKDFMRWVDNYEGELTLRHNKAYLQNKLIAEWKQKKRNT